MSGRTLLAYLVIAFVWGGVGGWIVRMHSEKGQALAAMARVYMAEKRNIDTQTQLALAELDRYRADVARQTMNNVKKRAKEVRK